VIELDLEAMSTTIRRGDSFGISLTVKNSSNGIITIARWDVVVPPGFELLSTTRTTPAIVTSTKGLLRRARGFFSPQGKDLSQSYYWDNGGPLAILGPSESYVFTIVLKAGRPEGFAPRPDTYKVEVNVGYADGDVAHFDVPPVTPHNVTGDVSVNVYPTLAGMLMGTVLGAALGSLLGSSASLSLSFAALATFLPKLITSIGLGLIAGIVFMRKKDVQPFLTIEDFWGGILVGFVVGFYGQSYFQKITGLG
jgi:hypothetical protein